MTNEYMTNRNSHTFVMTTKPGLITALMGFDLVCRCSLCDTRQVALDWIVIRNHNRDTEFIYHLAFRS
jgi:hypothetical protein